MKNKKLDRMIGILFAVSTVAFVALFLSNDTFFNWAFHRHHNELSWYIRPLFIIPIIYFAYKKSWAGVFASVFGLFTSMFWFPAPDNPPLMVQEFLRFEMDYLQGVWDAPKIMMSLLVPIFFILLIVSAWKHSFRWLIGTIIGAMVLKVLWSVIFSGDEGVSIIKPAVIGLVICILAVWYLKKRKKTD